MSPWYIAGLWVLTCLWILSRHVESANKRGPCEDTGAPEGPWLPEPLVKHLALKDRMELRQQQAHEQEMQEARNA